MRRRVRYMINCAVDKLVIPIIVVWVVIFVSNAWNREPPTQIFSYQLTDPMVPAGGVLRLTAFAISDEERTCSLKIRPFFLDSENYRYDQPEQFIPASKRREFVERSNNRQIQISRPVPYDMAQGVAKYVSTLYYYCNWTHEIWPITKVFEANFIVRGSLPLPQQTLPPEEEALK